MKLGVPRGFTLVEMVATIVVSSILILGIAGFIELGTTGYVDSVERGRLQTQAKFLLEKMSREVRHSIPNLVSTDSPAGYETCLNFYPIDHSGFYTVSGADLQFVIGDDYTNEQIVDVGKKLIINPARMADIDNAIELTSSNTSISGAVFTVTDGQQALVSESVAKRMYLFSHRVAYCLPSTVKPSHLQRVDNGQAVAISDNIVTQAEFRYDQTDLRRGSLIHIDLDLTQNGENNHYQQDIQVLNVP
ncbi:prepilin-type N-terminal cleavage/methylation domain-containing protein [Vibrio sp. AK197]